MQLLSKNNADMLVVLSVHALALATAFDKNASAESMSF